MSPSCGIGLNYIEISTKSVKDVFNVGHFDFVASTLSMIFQSTHVGTDTGSDTGSYTDISSHISPQIEILDKEAIYRVYQQKFGNIILGILQRIGLILLYISDK